MRRPPPLEGVGECDCKAIRVGGGRRAATSASTCATRPPAREFYSLSFRTGATRNDSAIDIDGGIGTVFSFAGKGPRDLPNSRVCLDGAVEGGIARGRTATGVRQSRRLVRPFGLPGYGFLHGVGRDRRAAAGASESASSRGALRGGGRFVASARRRRSRAAHRPREDHRGRSACGRRAHGSVGQPRSAPRRVEPGRPTAQRF